MVALRVYELNEKPLKGNFDFKHLKDIHKYLFQDIYSWSGEIRKCNIAKKDLFCLKEHIETFGNDIFKNNSYILKEKERLEYINIYCLDILKETIN